MEFLTKQNGHLPVLEINESFMNVFYLPVYWEQCNHYFQIVSRSCVIFWKIAHNNDDDNITKDMSLHGPMSSVTVIWDILANFTILLGV